jgi:hypothetical protein
MSKKGKKPEIEMEAQKPVARRRQISPEAAKRSSKVKLKTKRRQQKFRGVGHRGGGR